MKKLFRAPKRKATALTQPLVAEFIKGFVATGLLTTIQDTPDREVLARRTLRRALQGGCALTAGTLAARAWQDGQPLYALTGLGLGIASIMAVEQGIPDKPLADAPFNLHLPTPPLSTLEMTQNGQEES